MQILGRAIDLGFAARPAAPPADAGKLPAMLSRLPAPLLWVVSGLIVGLVGWDAFVHPVPVVVAVTAWGIYLLRAPIGEVARGLVAAPRAQSFAIERVAAVAAAPLEGPSPVGTVIMADLSLDGRLSTTCQIEVFGRLSGEVRCDVIRLHPGAELRGHVACRQIGVDPEALFEATARPTR